MNTQIVVRHDIQSSLGPFSTLPGLVIEYPPVVKDALHEIYRQYNRAFTKSVQRNIEFPKDYRFAFKREWLLNKWANNFCVQIDMVGLDAETLQLLASKQKSDVVEYLLGRIFEIENSIAMYQLLMRLFPRNGRSRFEVIWLEVLDAIRTRTGLPIGLLAVTYDKRTAMAMSEFGLDPASSPDDKMVQHLTGFDTFMGPDSYLIHCRTAGMHDKFAWFVRSSDPVSKLRRPSETVDHPLLQRARYRERIKANAVTINIDDPSVGIFDQSRINDSKWYASVMGMQFEIHKVSDLLTKSFDSFLKKGNSFADASFKGERLSRGFIDFLVRNRIDPDSVASGNRLLRFKPAHGSYGCYGHKRGPLTDGKVRSEVRREIRARGPYMVQPELPSPRVFVPGIGLCEYIDRVFVTERNGFAGFRSFLPVDTSEVLNGRNHGNSKTVWAEIM